MKLTPHIIAHLPYLAALAETGSFTSAAAQMNITQAAMSYQIKALEEKLNALLSSSTASLTSAFFLSKNQCVANANL
jgi:DNA-binding transcriptional LysR family regulator